MKRTLFDYAAFTAKPGASSRDVSPAKGSSSTSAAAPATAVAGSSCVWLPQLVTEPGWQSFLAPLLSDAWRQGQLPKIEAFLDAEQRQGKTVLPPRADLFAAFNGTPLASVKVVLLGQDPYHDLGQAHGLCFSVRPGVKVPPSLRNMYKELETDVPGFAAPPHGCLQSWADQGMLMLNATLTVEAHRANSHAKCGWQLLTDDAIAELSRRHPSRLVFLLWGNFAKKKKALIDTSRHAVVESAHPSPLSAKAWFGCRCFSRCNEELVKLGHTPIDWSLPATVE